MLKEINLQLQKLLLNMIRGNRRKSSAILASARKRHPAERPDQIAEAIIEELAEIQAVKNAMVNSPSVLPGVGTLIALGLMGIEDFFVLDQSIIMIMALHQLYDIPLEDDLRAQSSVIHILGQYYDVDTSQDDETITRSVLAKVFPQRYAGKGLDKGMKRIATRFFPRARGTRLLPAGIGLAASAVDGYQAIREIGRLTLASIRNDLNRNDRP